jgi:hypothetical protein
MHFLTDETPKHTYSSHLYIPNSGEIRDLSHHQTFETAVNFVMRQGERWGHSIRIVRVSDEATIIPEGTKIIRSKSLGGYLVLPPKGQGGPKKLKAHPQTYDLQDLPKKEACKPQVRRMLAQFLVSRL